MKSKMILILVFVLFFISFIDVSKSEQTTCNPSSPPPSVRKYVAAIPQEDVLKEREFKSFTKITSADETDDKLTWTRAYSSDVRATVESIGGKEIKIQLTYEQAEKLADMKKEGVPDSKIKKQAEFYLKQNAYNALSKDGLTTTIKTTTENLVYDKKTNSYLPVSEYISVYGGETIMMPNEKIYLMTKGVKYDGGLYCKEKRCINAELAKKEGWILETTKEGTKLPGQQAVSHSKVITKQGSYNLKTKCPD